jgi:hypothetical protein
MRIGHHDGQPPLFGGARLGKAGIRANDSDCLRDFFCQSAVAATQIHDDLAVFGRKQL